MRNWVKSLLLVMVLALTLPLTYGGCGGGGGGGGGGPQPTPDPGGIVIDDNDIGGYVLNNGVPEAGVWVIAETMSVHENLGNPAIFQKVVVTDGEGRYVVPDLPDATYDVWVRGYGLRDSVAVQVTPGNLVDLEAVSAADAREAALVYPANYWFAMLDIPDDDELPGTGPDGNGWSPNLQSSAQFVNQSKLGCQLCHQLGIADTRLSGPEAYDFGWMKANQMNNTANGLGRPAMVATFGDWGSRIAAGEYPSQVPPRPSGKERNMVLTMWEWGDFYTYAHDETSTDKRNPTLYPYAPVYGVDIGQDYTLEIDPINHIGTRYPTPTLGGFDTPWCNQTFKGLFDEEPRPSGFGTLGCPAPGGTSAHIGAYPNPANPHNPMLDDTGKVWLTTQVRREWQEDYPDFCLDDPAIMGTPESPRSHHRQLGYFDTQTQETVLIDTCYGNHHLHFDADGYLWTSGDSYVLGRFNPATFNPDDPNTLGPSQDWWEVVVDSDGDGSADTPIIGFNYGIIPNIFDGTVWTAQPGFPGRIVRFDPATEKFETYTPPAPGNGGRGLDVDTNGDVWICLSGSSHVAKFERDKCAQTWGTGDQCPEGWTLWEIPGPVFEGTNFKSDNHYYTWVDWFDTGGLGPNTVVCTGTGSDSAIAFLPDTEEFVRTYVPYPMGFYHRGQDGRIDDPNAGWKGRGWWVDYGSDPLLHTEIEKGFIFHTQYRPDPLAH